MMHRGPARISSRAVRSALRSGMPELLILDLGPADKVDPRVESLGKTFETVTRAAVVI
jgi:CRISPR-associated protein Cas2